MKMLDLFSSVRARVSVSLALGIGVVAATFGYFYRKKLLRTPPKKWIRVGEITDLMIYPIKSCAGIRLTDIQCSILGLVDGYLRDRVFMIITNEGQGITARTHPKIVKIQPQITGNTLVLTAPGRQAISIDLRYLDKQNRTKSTIWRESVSTVDCGDEVALWISRYIINDEDGFRLVYYPDRVPTRNAWSRKKNNKDLATHAGALHDVTSYMLMTEASMRDLNTRLAGKELKQVSHYQFRPNFLVNSSKKYAEDGWEWIKIGNVIFKNVMLCGRCILINIDPESGERTSNCEPLNTLKSYRMKPPLPAPIFGIHLGIFSAGTLKMGDPVYVGVTN